MFRARWSLLLVVLSCGAGAEAVERCWALNDDAIERCGDDLPCRHAAYRDPIATCFDAASCGELGDWLRCAAEAACTPNVDCTVACGPKPSECPRPATR